MCEFCEIKIEDADDMFAFDEKRKELVCYSISSWETTKRKQINYCHMCGKNLNNKESEEICE